MTVLHLNDKVEIKGGVEVYVAQLMQLLPAYNCSVYWLGIYQEDSKYTVREYGNSKVLQVDVDFSALVDFLNNYIIDQDIDLIHVHSLSNPALLRALFKLSPVVRSMHEPRMLCPGQGKFWRHSERVCTQAFGWHCFYHTYREGCCNRHPRRLWSAYQNTQFEISEGKANYRAIIVMSAYMHREAMQLGYQESQLVLNPYFTERVDAVEICNQAKASEKRLLFVGRLSRTKGVHYFIRAALDLLKDNHQLRVDIIGSGQDEDYFKSLVPVEMQAYFTFHGWKSRSEVSHLMSKAYLLAFPSIYPEAFGISGIEAMMRGKPVVGFDVGGVASWLRDGVTGFLVPSKDINTFKHKMALLIDDSLLYERMSAAAREVALAEFTPTNHLSLLERVYQNIIR